MVAEKKEHLKVSVVQMGSLSDFELIICVFLALKCRCVNRYSYQAIYYSIEYGKTVISSSFCEWLPTKLRHHACYTADWFVVIKHKSAALLCTLSKLSMSFW